MLSHAKAVAATDATVLLCGETGIAKEVIASANRTTLNPDQEARHRDEADAVGASHAWSQRRCARTVSACHGAPNMTLLALLVPNPPRRHFSMLRDFRAADFVTLSNGLAGMGASLAFVRYVAGEGNGSFWLGVALLPIALLMDILDGRVARWRHEASDIGRELDSLADVVSFGVAPAIMGFAVGLRGGWDLLCLTFFVACGISRLARYNVTAGTLGDETGKVPYFEGMPIPSSLLIATLLAVLFGTGHVHTELPLGALELGPGQLHPLALLYVLHGAAMVSKTLRIPKP